MNVPPLVFRAHHAAARERVLRHIALRGYRRSGATAPEAVDLARVLSDGDVLADAAYCLCAEARPVDAVVAATPGALPLAVACALERGDLRWLAVRGRIEGDAREGDRGVVLADAFGTGESVLAAVAACRAAGLRVVQVLALVDLEQGAIAAVRAWLGDGVPVGAVYTLAEVRATAAPELP